MRTTVNRSVMYGKLTCADVTSLEYAEFLALSQGLRTNTAAARVSDNRCYAGVFLCCRLASASHWLGPTNSDIANEL